MNNKLQNEKGFTLIELTLVLSVAIVLTAMIIPFSFKKLQEATEKEAIDTLIATIYSLQSYSMAHNEYTKLKFIVVDDKTHYIGESPQKGILIDHQLPVGMKLSDSSRLMTIEFHGNGNIVKSGVLTVVGTKTRTAITFQFQRGRMIIHESERVFLDGSDFNDSRIVSHF